MHKGNKALLRDSLQNSGGFLSISFFVSHIFSHYLDLAPALQVDRTKYRLKLEDNKPSIVVFVKRAHCAFESYIQLPTIQLKSPTFLLYTTDRKVQKNLLNSARQSTYQHTVCVLSPDADILQNGMEHTLLKKNKFCLGLPLKISDRKDVESPISSFEPHAKHPHNALEQVQHYIFCALTRQYAPHTAMKEGGAPFLKIADDTNHTAVHNILSSCIRIQTRNFSRHFSATQGQTPVTETMETYYRATGRSTVLSYLTIQHPPFLRANRHSPMLEILNIFFQENTDMFPSTLLSHEAA